MIDHCCTEERNILSDIMFVEWKFVKLVAQFSHCIDEKSVKKK